MAASLSVWQLLLLRRLVKVGIHCSLDGGGAHSLLDVISLCSQLGLACLGGEGNGLYSEFCEFVQP